jgi:ABC-type Mn2+/Zn2+ transport system ATPase subunit
MIEIKNLSFQRGSQRIIDNFSAKLSAGELVLLSGANGSGKSTLIELLGGALKPSSGNIYFYGRNLEQMSVKEQSEIRSVSPQTRLFPLAFKVNQLLSLLNENRRSLFTETIIYHLGLVDLLDSRITQLSKGQEQRVSLAISLIQEAKFYLIDEPFSAQDVTSIKNILALLLEIKTEKGVLVVSHNTETLHSHFDRVLELT